MTLNSIMDTIFWYFTEFDSVWANYVRMVKDRAVMTLLSWNRLFGYCCSKFCQFQQFWLLLVKKITITSYAVCTITSYSPDVAKTNILTVATIRCRNFDNSGCFDYFTLESPKHHTHHNILLARRCENKRHQKDSKFCGFEQFWLL